jgi:alanine racemase
MTVLAPVVSVRNVHRWETIGYSDARVGVDCVVATLRIGYTDGMPRKMERGSAFVVIGGVQCPIIGDSSMDYTTVVIPPHHSVSPGAVATVMGRAQNMTISLEKFAEWAEMLPEEVLVRFGQAKRAKRELIF